MGEREPRKQGLATTGLGLLALLAACGPSTGKGQGPKVTEPKAAADAGPDVEAQQIQAIADALNEFGPAVHTCWARAAADDFHVEGQLVLDVSFVAEGKTQVEVSKDDVGDPVLESCLVKLWTAYRWPTLFAVGDRIQLPPFEFVAPDAQYLISMDHMPTERPFGGPPAALILLDEKNTGNKAASFVKLEFDDASKQKLHTHTSAKLVLVLSGGGLVTGIGKPQKVQAGSAIYVAAGTVHGFDPAGESPTQLLEFFVPGGPEGGYRGGEAHEGTVFLSGGKAPRRGPKPMVRSVADAAPLKILGGKGEVRILFDANITGDKSAYLGALSAEPGAVVPLHRHAESSEYLFVIEGDAEMRIAGRSIPVNAGDGIQIPVGVEHGVIITGSATFKALQLYTPAGPEQRFKGGSK